eukprot:Plantae.Rhodophyta-Rhodochaete_pulchella.ctg1140.p3 GENE.Plantae.Rhodophyta-Rhodochaete_pulchella.ctg1140~~Plantae.Rhodophyta-Rhodochaete_pulchella.ctg1140.p3  ORF type:complete len:160 (+),score=33.24 Plantae.Rhodophyta-Rhodochaete_pulchella.ctg1140:40-480(+)
MTEPSTASDVVADKSDEAVSMLEVKKHTSRKSTWMVIHDKVYDVTSFLVDHPGGEDILLDSAGRDATREFEDVGHSSDARKQLDELYLAPLRPMTDDEKAIAEEDAKRKGDSSVKSGTVSPLLGVLKYVFPVVILAIAYVIRKYTA